MDIADEDVIVVARAAESSCMVDRADRAVGEVAKQAIHEVDRHLMVIFDVPYVSCLAEAEESLASEEMVVRDMYVDWVLAHSLYVEDTGQEVAAFGSVDPDLVACDCLEGLFAHS